MTIYIMEEKIKAILLMTCWLCEKFLIRVNWDQSQHRGTLRGCKNFVFHAIEGPVHTSI